MGICFSEPPLPRPKFEDVDFSKIPVPEKIQFGKYRDCGNLYRKLYSLGANGSGCYIIEKFSDKSKHVAQIVGKDDSESADDFKNRSNSELENL